jgi:hypothetical protein
VREDGSPIQQQGAAIANLSGCQKTTKILEYIRDTEIGRTEHAWGGEEDWEKRDNEFGILNFGYENG